MLLPMKIGQEYLQCSAGASLEMNENPRDDDLKMVMVTNSQAFSIKRLKLIAKCFGVGKFKYLKHSWILYLQPKYPKMNFYMHQMDDMKSQPTWPRLGSSPWGRHTLTPLIYWEWSKRRTLCSNKPGVFPNDQAQEFFTQEDRNKFYQPALAFKVEEEDTKSNQKTPIRQNWILCRSSLEKEGSPSPLVFKWLETSMNFMPLTTSIYSLVLNGDKWISKLPPIGKHRLWLQNFDHNDFDFFLGLLFANVLRWADMFHLFCPIIAN